MTAYWHSVPLEHKCGMAAQIEDLKFTATGKVMIVLFCPACDEFYDITHSLEAVLEYCLLRDACFPDPSSDLEQMTPKGGIN